MARRPIWLWPNLLSLDAPLVAVAWFWVFKQVWGVSYHQATLPWLLALVVWCIYVGDRLLDERLGKPGSRRDTPRHEFHRRHRQALELALVVGAILAVVLLRFQARGLFPQASLVLVPVAGYVLLAIYDTGRGVSYLKNVLGGMAFAYGTAVGVHVASMYSSDLRHLLGAREVVAFGILCFLNMTAIDHWEEARQAKDPEVKVQYETLLTLMLILLTTFALLMAFRARSLNLEVQKAFFIAIMVAAAALYVLNRLRSRFSLDALRVLADVAMLLPLPLFYVMINSAGS